MNRLPKPRIAVTNPKLYASFEDLHNAYGIGLGSQKTRDDFDEATERDFVQDCFNTYENIGFAETFGTPYSGAQHLTGKKFIVLSRVFELALDENGADLECLPMWKIRFEDGFEMDAFPEEICLAERGVLYGRQ